MQKVLKFDIFIIKKSIFSKYVMFNPLNPGSHIFALLTSNLQRSPLHIIFQAF